MTIFKACDIKTLVLPKAGLYYLEVEHMEEDRGEQEIYSKEEVKAGLSHLEDACKEITSAEAKETAKRLLWGHLTLFKIKAMPLLRLTVAGTEIEKSIHGIPLRLHEPDKHGIVKCDVLWALGIYRFVFIDGERPTLQYTPDEFEGTLPIPNYYDLPDEEYLEGVKLAIDFLGGKVAKEKEEISQNLIEKLIVANDQTAT